MTQWFIPVAVGVALNLSSPAIAGDSTARDRDLVACAEKGDLECVRELLASGANIESRSFDGLTPLMAASKAGSIGEVKELLALAADVEAIDYDRGMNALTYAIWQQREPVVRALLAAGAHVEPAASVYRPLSIAALGGPAVFVSILLDAGARVDGGEWHPATPLFLASCAASDDEKLQLLIDAGSDVNAALDNGMTPLLCAVAYSRKNAVRLLLANHADPNALTKNGECAWSLALAEQAGQKERSLGILDLLRETGAVTCSPESGLEIHGRPDQLAKKANSEPGVPDAGSVGSDSAATAPVPDQVLALSEVVDGKIVKGPYGNDPTAHWPKPIDRIITQMPDTLRKEELSAEATVVGIVDKEGNISTFHLMKCEVTRNCIPVDETLQKQYCPDVFAATIAGIEKVRFQPASLHGEPVKAHWTIRSQFHAGTEPSPPECRARRERWNERTGN